MPANQLDKLFVLKWWSLSIGVIAPVIYFGLSFILSGSVTIIWLLFPFSIFYSVPTLITTYGLFFLLRQTNISVLMIKFSLNMIVLIGITWTSFYFSQTYVNPFSILYTFAVLVGNIAFDLKVSNPTTSLSDTRSPQ